jgi:DNA-binding FrmR family transcriptional regulator
MVSERKKSTIRRLNRIKGQVAGVTRMIENGSYCIDLLTQLRAISAALRKVEDEILKDHAASCVSDAIESGDEAEQRKKFGELIDLIGRYR